MRRWIAALCLTFAFGSGAGPAAADEAGGKTLLLDAAGTQPVVLILPLNVAVVMPPDMAPHSERVWEVLTDYLESQPVRLKTVDLAAARALWLQSIRIVREESDTGRNRYENTARVFVAELSKHAEFDHVIAPSLYLREASVVRGIGEWDGARRTLPVEAEGAQNRRMAALKPFDGVAPAASLHAAIFDAAGDKLQEKVAGLDLIAQVVIPRKPDPDTGAPVIQFEPRPDVFADDEALREGIAAALAPFLEPPDS